MPTAFKSGPYRFFFYASDHKEPQHVHVECDDNIAKFWIDPIRLQNSYGFSRQDISRIQRIIQEHQKQLMEAWNDYFSC